MASKLRTELYHLSRLPPWGRAQGDDWDRHSNFIYDTHSLDELRAQTRRVANKAGLPLHDFACYVVHRWYNHHTHEIALELFTAHPRVRREANRRHRRVDIYLGGVPFDLKLTRFPRAYPGDLARAQAEPRELINWLYRHQSGEGRYHTANRLFLILHHARDPRRTWEVRRMFDLLERHIGAFLEAPRLLRADFVDYSGARQRPCAAAIFCIHGTQKDPGRAYRRRGPDRS